MAISPHSLWVFQSGKPFNWYCTLTFDFLITISNRLLTFFFNYFF